jgi:hypothetical protein
MWRLGLVLTFVLVMAAPGFADDETLRQIDDTFRSVNKHLYGEEGEAPSPQQPGDRQAFPDEPAPPPARSQQPPPEDGTPAARATMDDEHYIQEDDFFISPDAFNRQEWIYVKLAKMVTPPSTKTKKEAEFFQVGNGNRVWTKHYWQTRLARKDELKLGTAVVIFERGDNGIYVAPENKDEARRGSWFMARITDMSDLYKGYVTVSGGYKANVRNIRVAR